MKNRIYSFMIFCSGSDSEVLSHSPVHERIRQSSLGGIIMSTALLAFCSGGYALYTVFKSVWLACIFGLVWALIIFNLDRYFISTFCKNGKFWTDMKIALPRIILAIIIGLIISEPLKLKLFGSEITEHLNDGLEHKKAGINVEYESKIIEQEEKTKAAYVEKCHIQKDAKEQFDKNKNDINNKIGVLKSEKPPIQNSCVSEEKGYQDTLLNNTEKIKQLKDEIARKESYMKEREQYHLDECSGIKGTGKKGDGPECKRTYKAYEVAKEDYIRISDVNNDKIAALENDIKKKDNDRSVCYNEKRGEESEIWQEFIKRNNAKITELENKIKEEETIMSDRYNKAEEDYLKIKEKNDADIDNLKKLRNEQINQTNSLFSDGFLARQKALNDLTEQNKGLQAVTFMISLLFIMIEVLPVLAKAMQQKSSYDYSIETLNNRYVQQQLDLRETDIKMLKEQKIMTESKIQKQVDIEAESENRRLEKLREREFFKIDTEDELEKIELQQRRERDIFEINTKDEVEKIKLRQERDKEIYEIEKKDRFLDHFGTEKKTDFESGTVIMKSGSIYEVKTPAWCPLYEKHCYTDFCNPYHKIGRNGNKSGNGRFNSPCLLHKDSSIGGTSWEVPCYGFSNLQIPPVRRN